MDEDFLPAYPTSAERSITTPNDCYTPLDDQELNELFDLLDTDQDDIVTVDDLNQRIKEIISQIPTNNLLVPSSRSNGRNTGHRRHSSQETAYLNIEHCDDNGETHDDHNDGLPQLSRNLLHSTGPAPFTRSAFIEHARKWGVPTQKLPHPDARLQDGRDLKRIPLRRRTRAYLDVHGPTMAFVAFVISLQLGFGLWQLMVYLDRHDTRHTFGVGLIIAKASAGALYPTLFFMLISMSRRAVTGLRRWPALSRFINWDKAQMFHVRMAITALVLGTIHGAAHMAGTFRLGSMEDRQSEVAAAIHMNERRFSFGWWMASTAGITGILALSIFWIMALLAVPAVKGRCYEVFQLSHLLMFPLIICLLGHGIQAILQQPMLHYWLGLPSAIIFCERTYRHFVLRFRQSRARPTLLLDDIVQLTILQPDGKSWHHTAGQYILLQVPAISNFQWHPFTVSACQENKLSVHIKSEGNWTKALRDLAARDDRIRVLVDGPFGAPAQRFYSYDYSIVIGGGIGITPFASIINDLEDKYNQEKDPWEKHRRSSRIPSSCKYSRVSSESSSRATSPDPTTRYPCKSSSDYFNRWNDIIPYPKPISPPSSLRCASPPISLGLLAETHLPRLSRLIPDPSGTPAPKRRVDFHWTVRTNNTIHWFSALLNRALARAAPLSQSDVLQLNIHTHITSPRPSLLTHVITHLLDSYRPPHSSNPVSLLTGLTQPSHFGRPDFKVILRKHFDEVVTVMGSSSPSSIKGMMRVGVFYCGNPVVGEIISDQCFMLTAEARARGLRVRYEFMNEVFG